MADIWQTVSTFLAARFSTSDVTLLVVNLALFFAAQPVLSRLLNQTVSPERLNTLVRILRGLNLLAIFSILVIDLVLPPEARESLIRFVSAVMSIYVGYLVFVVGSMAINRRFGRTKTINEVTTTVETYNSRALRIILGVIVTVATIISVVQVYGATSLLEAGGVLGFFGVMLALTQGSWAPDLISGLIILNSSMVEEGDVIEIEEGGQKMIATVFRTKMFHTELLNVINNHRIMLKNTRVRDAVLHNLSRFASAKGLRERLDFNIGYDVPASRVEKMLNAVFSELDDASSFGVELQHPPEVRLAETGDDALMWSVFYYTKDVRNLIKNRQGLRLRVLQYAIAAEISLATPRLHVVESGTHADAVFAAKNPSNPALQSAPSSP